MIDLSMVEAVLTEAGFSFSRQGGGVFVRGATETTLKKFFAGALSGYKFHFAECDGGCKVVPL